MFSVLSKLCKGPNMIGMFPQIFAFRIEMLNGDLCAGLIVHTKISEGLLVELVGTILYSGLNRTFISCQTKNKNRQVKTLIQLVC